MSGPNCHLCESAWNAEVRARHYLHHPEGGDEDGEWFCADCANTMKQRHGYVAGRPE